MFQLLVALSKLFCFSEQPNEMFLFLDSYFTEEETEDQRGEVIDLKNGGVRIWTQALLTSTVVLFLIMSGIFMATTDEKLLVDVSYFKVCCPHTLISYSFILFSPQFLGHGFMESDRVLTFLLYSFKRYVNMIRIHCFAVPST